MPSSGSTTTHFRHRQRRRLYEGGSRGWTIFHKDGTVVYENGTDSSRQAIIQIGHYPDKRSDAKGVEPESVTAATFDGTPMIFVGAERASVVGVYDVTDPANPVLKQLLPSGVGPEGYVAIPGSQPADLGQRKRPDRGWLPPRACHRSSSIRTPQPLTRI